MCIGGIQLLHKLLRVCLGAEALRSTCTASIHMASYSHGHTTPTTLCIFHRHLKDELPVLYINQLQPSTLHWDALGLNVTMRSSTFSNDSFATMSLLFSVGGAAESFASGAKSVTVNLKVRTSLKRYCTRTSSILIAYDNMGRRMHKHRYSFHVCISSNHHRGLIVVTQYRASGACALQTRVPEWTEVSSMQVSLDGVPITCSFAAGEADTYCSTVRSFRTGDLSRANCMFDMPVPHLCM